MSEPPHDTRKTIEELIRHIMEMSGQNQPVIIGIQIIIPPAGQPGGPPPFPGREGTEPDIEVHTFGNRVTLITELPGMSPENVQVLFRDDRVYIWAKDDQRQYRSSSRVPPAEEKSIEISFRHGVLEVTYTAASLPAA
jgi:HSP20 family molecular chaperone IbpA